MYRLFVAILLVFPVTLSGQAIGADRGQKPEFRLWLSGEQEVPTLITASDGAAVLRIVGATIQYDVRYRNLESDITQAHIHLGASGTNGGVLAFLCTNLGNGPAGTAACPPSPGRLIGVIDAVDVIGPGGQGVAPGQIEELQRAVRGGVAYVNIHTTGFPAGEIRGDTHRHFWPY